MIASAARYAEQLPYPRYLDARRLRQRGTGALMERDGLLQAGLPSLRGGAWSCFAALQAELGFVLRELNISSDEDLHRAYFERIPVVAVDGEELCEYFVEETLVRERLESRR